MVSATPIADIRQSFVKITPHLTGHIALREPDARIKSRASDRSWLRVHGTYYREDLLNVTQPGMTRQEKKRLLRKFNGNTDFKHGERN